MNAHELMLGNYVNTNRAHGRGQKQLKKVQINLHYLQQIENNCNYIEPIPLTEEWLLKFNGKFKDISHRTECFFNSCCFEIYLDKNEITLIYTGGEGVELSNPIRYLHQLQNLYFALTGTHLTLK